MKSTSLIRQPDRVRLVNAQNQYMDLTPDGSRFAAGETSVTCHCTCGQMQVHLDACRQAPLFVILRWQEKLPRGARFLADTTERSYGDLEWRGMVPQRQMPWYFLMKQDGSILGWGVGTGPNALCRWQADPEGVTLWLDLRCGNSAVEKEEISLDLAQVLVNSYEDCTEFEAAEQFCKAMADGRGRFPERPVYGGNNWYYAYGRSSHGEILRDAELIAKLSQGNENRPYMVIDDGWQVNWTPGYNGGPWSEGNVRFPDMQKLADEIRAMGVIPGIWLRPLADASESIPAQWRSQRDGTSLDLSHPEVLAHISGMIARIHRWGYGLIKHDYSTYDLFGYYGDRDIRLEPCTWSLYDRTLTNAQAIRQFYRTIFEAAGDSLVMGCNCIGHLGVGAMQLYRIGDDTSGVCWERTRRMGVNTLAFRMAQHKAFYDIDGDCIGITARIPWERNRQWLKLLALSGTPLFMSASGKELDSEKWPEVAEAFRQAAMQNHKAQPLDWLDNTCPDCWRIDGEEVFFSWYGPQGAELMG